MYLCKINHFFVLFADDDSVSLNATKQQLASSRDWMFRWPALLQELNIESSSDVASAIRQLNMRRARLAESLQQSVEDEEEETSVSGKKFSQGLAGTAQRYARATQESHCVWVQPRVPVRVSSLGVDGDQRDVAVTRDAVATWYVRRARQIDCEVGRLDLALSLLQPAREFGENVRALTCRVQELSTLVYSCELDSSLDQYEQLNDQARLRFALLSV